MDPDRKRQILNAEDRFTLRERLSRALAEKGIYVMGRLTHDTQPRPARSDDDQPRENPGMPVTETISTPKR